ncbi:M6 family metalloprotease domain-containing protein [Saccharothrix coeruleofusca]|uniref:M6 family metalloprotease-like protein n=1 Tax=Saccharothrix coeruleofusca TaxID=33919 RepID=A0A918AL13_9PSEU|nr:M6 family metalloprotease domain-containing protein [Saccharothrix coeruleofusca]GGP54243.1 hypothetical protein GCM10010185_28380 [Saccharothrix coeruleofusca]
MPVPFFDEELTFTEPDGSSIRVRGWGNQWTAVFEALDGHTVVRHPGTGYHHYAGLSPDRSALVPLEGARVGEVDPATLGLPRHLRPVAGAGKRAAAAALEAMPGRPRWMRRREEKSALRALGEVGALEITGSVTGLCLLIQFPDVPGTISVGQVEDYCNQLGYTGFGNNGSVRDYFRDISAGRLDYTNVVTAYYTTTRERAYYTDPAVPYGTRAREVIVEALTALRSRGFDFSGLTPDDQGYIRALNVFYAGPVVNNWSEGLWPHAWALAEPFEATPTTRFSDYQISNMGDALTLGTFCHENGHMVCDFPDLYDYGGESAGTGSYCLMSASGGTNPVQVCAFLKNEAGWAEETADIVPGSTYTLDAGRNDFLLHRRNDREYFILENRARSGRDANLPDAGLAIWHVDEDGSNSNEQMTPSLHYMCSLEQADNAFDLERGFNQGDAADLFGAPSATSFSDFTAPSGRWWDGSASGLRLERISAPGPSMTLRAAGGLRITTVSAVADRSNNAYAFALDTEGVLHLASSTGQGAWSRWEAGWNGAPALRDVTAVNDRSNALFVFGLAPDGTVHHSARDTAGAWGPWRTNWNGAPRLQSITALVDQANELHLFGIASDGTVHHSARNAAGTWGRWQANWNAAPRLGSVAAVADLVGNVLVFGVAPDGTAHLASRDASGSWTPWQAGWSGAPRLTAITAAHDRTSAVHVFGVAADGTVHLVVRDGQGRWSPWQAGWNGAPALRAVVPVGDLANGLHVFGVAPDDVLHLASRDASGAWTAWQAGWNGAPELTAVVPLAVGDDTLHVFGITGEGQVRLASRTPLGAWSGWTALG